MNSIAGSNDVPLSIRLATAVRLRRDSRAFATLFLHEERQPQNLEAVLEEALRIIRGADDNLPLSIPDTKNHHHGHSSGAFPDQ